MAVKLIKHEAHKKGYRPHFHIEGKAGHSVFKLVVPGAHLGSIVGRKTGSQLLGEILGFPNPLSDVQELLNFLDYLSGGEEENASAF